MQEERRSELTMTLKKKLVWTAGTACYCDLETLEVIRMKHAELVLKIYLVSYLSNVIPADLRRQRRQARSQGGGSDESPCLVINQSKINYKKIFVQCLH